VFYIDNTITIYKRQNNKMGSELPYVSVCTPTFNRRPFFQSAIQCFNHQSYPKHRMEWIIIDDGTDKIEDLVASHPNVKYFKSSEKMTLGKKRNLMHANSCGDIIVYMDDDDYYPPERVSHAVESLMANPSVLCAGSSEIYIFFKHLGSLMQFGPYGPNHATAGTFAFRRELLTHTRYNDDACLAEERFFLKDYTIPMLQLDPTKVILVFSHNHNTFDKRKLLVNANPAFVKPTNKTLDSFIRGKTSMFFKDFFINKMDALLEAYAPGKPEMKPDVIKQTKELEQTLIRMQQQQQQQQPQNGSAEAPAILMHQEGKEPVALTSDQVLNIIQTQQTEIKTLMARISLLEAEKTKSESMLYNMVSVCAECTEPGNDSNSKAIIEQCLKDVTERDDKLKKTKALYIKSIGETSDLKRQLNDLRCQIQELQGAALLQSSSDNTSNTAGKLEDPIRLVIDE
jgi:hypothetical protein